MAQRQLSVRLEADLVRAVKVRAAQIGESLTAVIERGLRAYLASDGQDRRLEEGRARAAAVLTQSVVQRLRAATPSRDAHTVEVTVAGLCRRCGHEARKHTPACYVAGCPCRKVQGQP